MGRDWQSCESGEIGHAEPLQWEKIGKVVNQAKLAVQSHFECYFIGKRFEKLQIRQIWLFQIILSHFGGKRKVVNQVKLPAVSHSEPLWWEKIGKVNWAKLAVLSHSEPLWWYHLVV